MSKDTDFLEEYSPMTPGDSGHVPYTCICDEGWTTGGQGPACNVDVNECALPNPPCSKVTNTQGCILCPFHATVCHISRFFCHIWRFFELGRLSLRLRKVFRRVTAMLDIEKFVWTTLTLATFSSFLGHIWRFFELGRLS